MICILKIKLHILTLKNNIIFYKVSKNRLCPMDSYKERILKSSIGETILFFVLLDILYLVLGLEKMKSYIPIFIFFFLIDIVYNIVQLKRTNYHETFGLSMANYLIDKKLIHIVIFVVIAVFIFAIFK